MLTAGTTLGPYEILSALGAGGMGEVYKARDTRLDRTVAIKVLPAQLAADPQFRDRFDREARTISALEHPHICPLYDVGEQDGTSFLVMQYLEGETLQDRLAKGPLPLDQALTTAIQIASALDKAHRAGITHRDLKPGNIMLTKAGAKLLDFGLAKASRPVIAGAGLSMLPTTPPNLTAQGAILGTFQYMAPEQLEGQEADARTDIFAFGAVVYEMVTGRNAFQGKSHASLISAIMSSDPLPMTSLQPLASPALDRVVRKCLAKDPDDRWQTARDLLDELKWVTQEPTPAVDSSPVGTRGDGRGRSRERLAWSLATLGVIVAVAAGAVAVSHWREPPPRITQFVVLPPESTVATVDVVVSPDGRAVAFTGRAGGVTRLWIRGLESVAARLVPNSDGASYPFWSPDSASIGFFADGKLKKVATAGGPPQSLCDASSARGGTWSADGVIVFASGTLGPLHQVSASGGNSKPVTALDAGRGETSHRFPWFLPDGRHFLFAVGATPFNVYVASLDGGERTSLLTGVSNVMYAEPGYVVFARENTLLAQRFDPKRLRLAGDAFPIAEDVAPDAVGYGAFSVSATGTLLYRQSSSRSGLVWFDRRGARLNAINAPDRADQFALSPDGRQVAVRARSPGGSRNDIWIVDLQRNTSSRLTLDAADHGGPTWSPDGKRIVFYRQAADASGRSMFEQDVSGTIAAVEILKASSSFSMGTGSGIWDWSHDGRFIVFSYGSGSTGPWALPRNGDPKPFPLVQGEGNQVHAQVSPDNRWLAYSSSESGRFEVYVQEFPKGQHRVRISTASGQSPHWRGDSRELYYLTAEAQIMAVPIRAGATLEPGAPAELFQIRTVGGPFTVARRQFQPTADGQRFLVRTPLDDSVNPPIVTLNWTAGLKK